MAGSFERRLKEGRKAFENWGRHHIHEGQVNAQNGPRAGGVQQR